MAEKLQLAGAARCYCDDRNRTSIRLKGKGHVEIGPVGRGTWLGPVAVSPVRHGPGHGRRAASPLQATVNVGDDEGNQFIDLMASGGDLPGDKLEREELARRVRSTVKEMPDSLREILLLSYFDQFPYKQIGDILGIPLGTVKSRLHTAVADFANRWKVLNKVRRGA